MMHFALNSMINVQIPNVCGGNNLITPLPHQGRDPLAKELFPWRASLDRYSYLIMIFRFFSAKQNNN